MTIRPRPQEVDHGLERALGALGHLHRSVIEDHAVSALQIAALEEPALYEEIKSGDDLFVSEALGGLISNEEINSEPKLMIEAALGGQLIVGRMLKIESTAHDYLHLGGRIKALWEETRGRFFGVAK